MNALSDEARALIDGVLKHDDPTPGDRARVRTRLAAELGAAAFATLALSAAGSAASAGSTTLVASEAGTATVSASGKAAQGTTWSLFGKLSLSGAALALAAGALWFSAGESNRHETRGERVAPREVVAPAPVSTTATDAPLDEAVAQPQANEAAATEVAPAREGPSKRNAAARKVAAVETETPAPTPAPSTLGQELKMLAEAQAALRAGAPERALALVVQHRASFPDGVMKEERQGIEALASCALGRDYRAQAEQFLRSAQSSPLAARVRKACGLEP